MDKQLVAQILTDLFGQTVTVGLHRGFTPKLDAAGKPIVDELTGRIIEVPYDHGELFTLPDGSVVSATAVKEAEAEALKRWPTGKAPREPTDDEVMAEAIRAKVTKAELDAARKRLKGV